MNRILKIFKYVAYLNIPFILGALYFVYKPLLTGGTKEELMQAIPIALVLVGFGFSFTSLRDVKKIDKMGRALIERPKLFLVTTYFFLLISVIALCGGIYFIIETDLNQRDLGVGIAAFSLGLISMIKSIVDQAKDLTNLYD